MKVHIVVCHYNNPNHLNNLINTIEDKNSDYVKFFIIDNSSTLENINKINKILSNSVKNYEIIIRENENREAGAYWYYITEVFTNLKKEETPDIVLFTQEELHQYPMAPKGRISTEENPFYPHSYGINGVNLSRIYEYLNQNPNDQVGFGGRIEKVYKKFDPRWRRGYWPSRWKSLNIEYYLFFSGACFAIHKSMIQIYLKMAKPTKKDYNNEYFPWMWERMWGTIPALNGGKLVHYKDFSDNIMIKYTKLDTLKRYFIEVIAKFLPTKIKIKLKKLRK